MRRTRRRTLAVLAVPATVAAIVAISGCTSSSTASGTTQAGSKGTLTLGMSQDIYGWDPSNQPSYQGWAGMAVYDELMRCNAQGPPSRTSRQAGHSSPGTWA